MLVAVKHIIFWLLFHNQGVNLPSNNERLTLLLIVMSKYVDVRFDVYQTWYWQIKI